MNIRRKISFMIFVLMLVIGGFFYINDRVNYSQGSSVDSKTISVDSGDNALIVGEKLSNAKIISGKYYFVFYLWKTDKLHSIVAGVYEFPKGMQIPEAAKIVTGGEVVPMRIKITFPEGWTIKDCAERLNANGLPGDEFAKLASNPTQLMKDAYPFLKELPIGSTLEGYLFPDTYYFSKDASASEIVNKMLDTFSAKVFSVIKKDLDSQEKSLFEIITMASIVEGEVTNDADRKIVSGLFWNRLENGMPLQSDATLEYALGTNKIQHSIAETKIDSPYNSYQNKGLPPGPVSNPGLASILAAMNPQQTDFVYFLSDPKTGKTIFAKTFEQHVANKAKYGL
jgi:UPF0755 protein